ncbi:unnamed protein product [Triticum turgidum subsp. durum]|uniref:Uncharacterized protein n=1 Tax=Triticum turgidum subsp. durum TaxID=4567 RepID=A0A9R0UWD8_TRITD|nr:unnamed protein product [Triticum turgidum subsp. durum]
MGALAPDTWPNGDIPFWWALSAWRICEQYVCGHTYGTKNARDRGDLMATAEETGDGLEFLSDPVDRFPLPDLEGTDFSPDGEEDTILTQSAAESSMGDVGDPAPALQLAIDSTCDALILLTTNSQCSAKEEGDEATGWAKSRVRVGQAPIERPPCAGRVSALEKSLRGYAEKKTETVVVPAVGNSFDSLGEAYDYYNLYSWEI